MYSHRRSRVGTLHVVGGEAASAVAEQQLGIKGPKDQRACKRSSLHSHDEEIEMKYSTCIVMLVCLFLRFIQVYKGPVVKEPYQGLRVPTRDCDCHKGLPKR